MSVKQEWRAAIFRWREAVHFTRCSQAVLLADSAVPKKRTKQQVALDIAAKKEMHGQKYCGGQCHIRHQAAGSRHYMV